MLYIISDASVPVSFASAGNLTNEDHFLHPRRIIDSYELISVIKGTLHIQSGERSYLLTPGRFVILFPEELHFGTCPSEGELSFYWTHFYFNSKETSVCTAAHTAVSTAKVTATHTEEETVSLFSKEENPLYILPETGSLSPNSQVNVLFAQLLNLAKRPGALALHQCSFAQSALLLELTGECFFRRRLLQQNRKIPSGIADLMEWLQLNYDTTLSVAQISEKFGYHPSYLTSVFKQYSQYTITEYLNRQRILAAKNLLTATRLTLAEISSQVGIRDEKYFMRLFKRYEGITASSYRESFSEKKKNRI